MLKKIALGLVALIALLVIVIAMRPSRLHIERSAVFAAPPDALFAQVNSLRAFTVWSPWDRIDPAMKKTHEGPEAGVGAIYRWSGNDQAGEGAMTITESKPGDSVTYKLEFLRPMADIATARFTLKPQDGGTALTWSFDGEQSFVEKAFGLLIDLDQMLGAQFEEGFNNLRPIVEKPA